MRLDDALAGKHIRCPGCQGVLLVPSNPATVKPATSSPTPAQRQRLQATPKPAAESKTRVQSSPPPERKRRQTAVPTEPSSYEGYDPYDGAALPPRPTGTRAKASKSSSFNILPIIAVLGVVLLLGGAGFGVWKLVQLIPEDFGKSKSLLGQPRGQYGPFTLVIPNSASKSNEEEVPLIAGSQPFGRKLIQTWGDGEKMDIMHYEFDTFDVTYPLVVKNHLSAGSPTDIVDSWCSLEWSDDHVVRFQWQPSVDLQVNGLVCARRIGKVNFKRGLVRHVCVLCCRMGPNQIVVYQISAGNGGGDPFTAMDRLIGTLKYKADEPTSK